ncbi:hypothetical protein PCANC_12017 [Puccinia coronata f. sp. avenae]|uniref:Uncharacterized protein n=1 Tax=Puccinia coronata f. sp. avenae TaxID=200324 RepID=A0A2N5UUJ4_9BASI|nr:hypothetical protein PCANC_18224 [Puccinia coronata f. sp. avenae]PLW41404.1 hypothetical protein PCANC_12017 [Puccinia coronata f. sp. avenae]
MVAFTHLLAFLFVLVAASRGDDASSAKPQDVSDKFFVSGASGYLLGSGYYLWQYNPLFYQRWYTAVGSSLYGYITWPVTFSTGAYFVKAIESDDDAKSVTCKTQDGQSSVFSPKDCLAAVQEIIKLKSSSASVGGCKLSLVQDKGPMAPANITPEELKKGILSILKACETSDIKSGEAKAAPKLNDKQVAMLLSAA